MWALELYFHFTRLGRNKDENTVFSGEGRTALSSWAQFQRWFLQGQSHCFSVQLAQQQSLPAGRPPANSTAAGSCPGRGSPPGLPFAVPAHYAASSVLQHMTPMPWQALIICSRFSQCKTAGEALALALTYIKFKKWTKASINMTLRNRCCALSFPLLPTWKYLLESAVPLPWLA